MCVRDGVVLSLMFFFFFQAEDGIRDSSVTGVQTCALPIFPNVNTANRRCNVGCEHPLRRATPAIADRFDKKKSRPQPAVSSRQKHSTWCSWFALAHAQLQPLRAERR